MFYSRVAACTLLSLFALLSCSDEEPSSRPSRGQESAIQIAEEECDRDVLASCLWLGLQYEKGTEVERDGERARALASKACDGGYMLACATLGLAYTLGDKFGVERDYARALAYFERACAADEPAGCLGVADAYWSGLGVAPDRGRAVDYYDRACDGGSDLACDMRRAVDRSVTAGADAAITRTDAASAPPAASAGRATALGLGDSSSCAVLTSGRVACWGVAYAAPPSRARVTVRTPTAHPELAGVIAVTGGNDHTCALKQDRTVVCWGQNTAGELGDGSGMSSVRPVLAQGLGDVVALSARFAHTCALTASGTVWCWGRTFSDPAGSAPRVFASDVPVQVGSLPDATNIATGYFQSCAVKRDGTIACWGDVDLGTQSGAAGVPHVIPGVADAVEVVAGQAHTCARIADGRVLCWGQNLKGELGHGNTYELSAGPAEVLGVREVVQLRAGRQHTCARLRSGSVVCWGANDIGQLGNGQSGTNRFSPRAEAVKGLTDAVELAAGGSHSCARKQTGDVVCWGGNHEAQVAGESPTVVPLPTVVPGL